MSNRKNKLYFGLCMMVILIATYACNSAPEKGDDYSKTHAWESFQRSNELYHSHDMKGALSIVDSLIADDNYKAEGLTDEQARRFLTHIYRQRVRIMAFNNDQPQLETWSRKTAELCRSFDGTDDGISCVQAEMDIFLGTALVNTGRQQEGFRIMNDAINRLDDITSWEGRQAQISCMYKMAAQYKIGKNSHCLDSLSRAAISKLVDLSGRYGEIEGLADSTELKGFVDFFTGKFLAWRAYAFVNRAESADRETLSEAYLDSARICVDKARKTQWAGTRDADVLLFDVYPFIGMYADFDKASEVVEKQFGVDSLNNMYVRLLYCKSMVEEKHGNLKGALQLQRRASDIATIVYYNNIQSQMAQTVERHQLDNERVVLLETRSRLQQMVILSLALAILIVCAIIYYVYRQRKHREIYEQFRAVIEKYETENAEKTAPVPADEPSSSLADEVETSAKEMESQTELYAKIMTVMKEQRPYEDPDFDVEKLSALVFSNRTYVSKAINKVSGKNFHAWLAEIRNDVAIQNIRKNPDLSVNEICVRTGHRGKEIFSRQFKQLNGITFTEFRNHLH